MFSPFDALSLSVHIAPFPFLLLNSTLPVFFFLLMLILPLSPQVLAYFYTVTDRQHSLVWYSFNLKFHKTCLDSKEIPTPYSSERIILDSSGLGSFCLQERRKVLCESEIMKESLNHPT